MEIGRDDPDAMRMAGYTIAILADEREAGLRAIERALALNPNSAHGWLSKGLMSCFLNNPEPAIEAFERSIRLSPVDPLGYISMWGLALAHFLAGRYETSLKWTEQSARDHPRYVPPSRLKVVLDRHFGRTDEAKEALRRTLELTPGLTIARLQAHMAWLVPTQAGKVYLQSFRELGLPEE